MEHLKKGTYTSWEYLNWWAKRFHEYLLSLKKIIHIEDPPNNINQKGKEFYHKAKQLKDIRRIEWNISIISPMDCRLNNFIFENVQKINDMKFLRAISLLLRRWAKLAKNFLSILLNRAINTKFECWSAHSEWRL